MKKTVLIATALVTWALSPSAAQDTSSILQSLPAEVQKNIEDTRAACREYFTSIGIDPSQSGGYVEPRVSSGDGGLMLFTVSGSQAVIVSDLHLCGDQCIKGVTCSTAGGSGFNRRAIRTMGIPVKRGGVDGECGQAPAAVRS